MLSLSQLQIEYSNRIESILIGEMSSCKTLVIAFHGYAESAKHMRERLSYLDRHPHMVCLCLEAPHPIYLPNGKVGSSWLCRYRRGEALVNNLNYLESVIAHLARLGQCERLVWLGYSQGAQMAMRAAEVFGGHHLIAIAGELPPELLDSSHEDAISFSSTHRAGSNAMKVALMGGKKDMALKDGVFERAKAWYASKGHLVEEVRWNGGHGWNEGMDQAVQEQLLVD